MGTLAMAKMGVQAFANLLLLAGICLTLAGMFTSRWQIANFGRDQVFEHGLYKDCVKSTDERAGILNTGEYLCFYKYDQRYFQYKQTLNTIKLRDWQEQCMYMFGASCALALLAIICSFITYCVRVMAIPWSIFCLFAALLSLAGLITFLRWSNESANRLFEMRDVIVEQQYGESLTMAIAGCILYFIASILSGIVVTLVFLERRKGGSVDRIPGKQPPVVIANGGGRNTRV